MRYRLIYKDPIFLPNRIGPSRKGSLFRKKEAVKAPLRIGMVGAQSAARLHLENYCPLRGSKVEITAGASRTRTG